MLAQRRRGHGGGGKGKEEEGGGSPGEHLNRLLGFGVARNSKLGGAYHLKGGGFLAYPQGAVQMTKIVQVAIGSSVSIALDDEGRVFVAGGGAAGAGGVGIGHAQYFQDQWTRVGAPETGSGYVGSKRLFYREKLTVKTKTWWQPNAPHGVVFPTKADVAAKRVLNGVVATWYVVAVSCTGGLCLALTSDGRVLSWGSGQYGALANGQEFAGLKLESEEAGEYPQFAPWWMQTGGPIQSETGHAAGGRTLTSGTPGSELATYTYDQDAPGSKWGSGQGANIAGGIVAIDAAEHFSLLLAGTGDIYYAGFPAGNSATYKKPYVTKDPIVNIADKTTKDPTTGVLLWPAKPIAIAATRGSYAVLLENGEVRFVGNNIEYTAGNGIAASSGTGIREVLVPTTADGKPVVGVIAIAKGEYSIKFLKSDGTVWTCGSNIERQQGFPGRAVTSPVEHVTKQEMCLNAEGELESLYAGGREVIAIEGAGESTHAGGESTGERLPGANGGDGFAFLLSDSTVRVSGVDWGYNSGIAEKPEGYGTLGRGVTENSDVPAAPLGDPEHIVGIAAGTIHMFLTQEPGTPAAPTLIVSNTTSESVTVVWSDPPGAVFGEYPLFRDEEGFIITLTEPEKPETGEEGFGEGNLYEPVPTYTSGFIPNRDGSGNLIRSFTFTGVKPGHYEARVASQTVQQSAVIDAVTLTTAIAKGSVVATLASTAALVAGTAVSGTGIAVGTIVTEVRSSTVVTLSKAATKTESVGLVYERNVKSPVGGKVHLPFAPPAKPVAAYIALFRRKQAVPSNLPETTVLKAALSTAAPITSLPAEAPEAWKAGRQVRVTDGVHNQVFTLSANVAKKAVGLPVASATPTFAFPIGSEVIEEPARLTAALATTAPITSLPIVVPEAWKSGHSVIVTGGGHTQTFTLSGNGVVGAASLPVQALTPTFAFPVGSEVVLGVREDWRRATPEIDPAATSADIVMAPPTLGPPGATESVTSDEAEWEVLDAYESAYKTRRQEVLVQ
jgi:alpha-tubulin suppressor-like RCC1 family protein